jgi:hypothetical protein
LRRIFSKFALCAVAKGGEMTAPIQAADLAPNVETASKRLSENLEVVTSALTQLGVPPKLRDFVCVLLAVSNGNTRFEAGYMDIANRLYSPNAAESRQARKARVKRLLIRLGKWQTKTGIDLMRIISYGKRTETPEKTIYEKTIFELTLLEPLARAMMTPPDRRAAAISKAVKEVLSDGATVAPPRPTTPTMFLLQRVEKTIQTKAGKLVKYAVELGLDPVERLKNSIARMDEQLTALLYQQAYETGETSIKTGASLGGSVEKRQKPTLPPPPLSQSIPLSDNHLVGAGEIDPVSVSEEADIVPELEETEKYETPLCTIDENKFSIRDRAFALARSGFFVLPLYSPKFDGDKISCSCKKGDGCPHIGKHPQYDFMTLRFGVTDASRDPELIRFWFEKWPDANLGIATGKRSNLLVLDVDGLSGAFALDEIEHEFTPLPETLIQRTGKPHGKHYLFSYPDLVSIPNSVGDIGNGLDIRSDGGYIVADPSIHKSGRRYEIESYAAPLAPPPAWFVGLVLASKRAAKMNALAASPHPQATSSNYPAFIGDGIRNYKVFRYGCGLANSFSPDEKLSRLRRLNETRVLPPLDEHELLKAHKSSERYR